MSSNRKQTDRLTAAAGSASNARPKHCAIHKYGLLELDVPPGYQADGEQVERGDSNTRVTAKTHEMET